MERSPFRRGRSAGTRTPGLNIPNVARYQLRYTPAYSNVKKICAPPDAQIGADDEARTRYLHLGKVALYQMSYIRKTGASDRNRTSDTRIFSPLLYQLSYKGIA